MRLIPLCLVVVSIASITGCAPMVTQNDDPSGRTLSDGPMQAGRSQARTQHNTAIDRSARNGGN